MSHESIDKVRDHMADTLNTLRWSRHTVRGWIKHYYDYPGLIQKPSIKDIREKLTKINMEIDKIKQLDYEDYFYKYMWESEDAQDFYRSLK